MPRTLAVEIENSKTLPLFIFLSLFLSFFLVLSFQCLSSSCLALVALSRFCLFSFGSLFVNIIKKLMPGLKKGARGPEEEWAADVEFAVSAVTGIGAVNVG